MSEDLNLIPPSSTIPDPATEWIIEDVMPAHELTLFAGSPGVGKTGILLQIIPAIARAEPIWGHRTFGTQADLLHLLQIDPPERTTAGFLAISSVSPIPFPFHSALDQADEIDPALHHHPLGEESPSQPQAPPSSTG